ncbi:hypothetical protein AKJ51_02990 [candidate division MSBL1 archaeon SCGC-AAA382A20]|uniref:Uncharacterized protein n=1 Tax=candidate division MSBL1 archaeon SCGC-AAA382A20 TaxID=1698280 RepID=A0A133VJY6_9EURY|nr:hypothetical protein AKJ51_02990 [candidate division MSBL1 archaeon SCGC-AAA382A20]
MTHRVHCEECKTKTNVTDQVMKILNEEGVSKVYFGDLEVECCENPSLAWITSNTIYENKIEKIKGRIGGRGRPKKSEKLDDEKKEKVKKRIENYKNNHIPISEVSENT